MVENYVLLTEVTRVNIAVTGGGVQTGAVLEGNNFQGQVISRINYTGEKMTNNTLYFIAI